MTQSHKLEVCGDIAQNVLREDLIFPYMAIQANVSAQAFVNPQVLQVCSNDLEEALPAWTIKMRCSVAFTMLLLALSLCCR